MDIHINRLRVDVEIDEERGLILPGEHAGVRRHHGFLKIRMAHIAPVHKEILLCVLPRRLWLCDKPVYRHKVRIRAYLH